MINSSSMFGILEGRRLWGSTGVITSPILMLWFMWLTLQILRESKRQEF